MFLSRIWTLLLALIAGALVAVVLLATDLVNRERLESATSLLYKESDKVEVTLTLHARKRLDVLVAAAADEDVRKILAEVSANADKASSVKDKLLKVLLEKNNSFGKLQADLLIAVDSRGTVVGQVGTNPQARGYSLAGFPTVDAALRGYVRDDVWKLDNDVVLIAARPVIQNGRYVGAVIHLLTVDDKLAAELSPKVLLAFFSGTTIIAAGAPDGKALSSVQRAVLAEQLEKVLADKQFKEKGYSEVVRVAAKDGELMAVFAQVHGEAAANDVGYLLLTPLTQMASPTEFYDKAGTQDIEKLPRLYIGLAILLVVLLGWLWPYVEAERPVANLHKAVVALETSDPKDQLNIYKFRRRIRKIAAAFNKVSDIKAKAAIETAAGAGKSIDSILGKTEGARLSSASFKFVEASSDDIPDAPPPPSAPGPRAVSGPQAVAAPPRAPLGAPPPPAPGAPAARPPVPPPPPAHSQSATPPTPDEEQAYFRKIHAEFVALKQRLGEPVDQLTFDRFEVTLKKNRDALVARYGCKVVQFQVYEKEGKASLKATPVK
jgi:hypothetical protein